MVGSGLSHLTGAPMNRFTAAAACFLVSIDLLTATFDRLTPGYVPLHWWEAPWWLCLFGAIVWVPIGLKVLKDGVQ